MGLTLCRTDLARLTKALRTLVSPFAAAGAEAWPACIVRELSALFRADKALILLPGGDGGGFSGFGIDDSVLGAYADYYSALDHGMWVRRRELGVEVWSRRLLWTRTELRNSEYYNDFVVPNRLYDAVGLTVERAGEGPAGVSFYHARPRGERFGERTLQLLRLLRPAFRTGVDVWLRLGRSWDGVQRLLDALDDGLLLCDSRGRVLHVNRRLGEMLARDPERDRLRAELERLVASFTLRGFPSAGAGSWERLSAAVRTAGGSYRLRGVWVDTGAGPPATCILVTLETEALVLPGEAELRRGWGLTARQAQVARMLARGRSNAEIAAALNISPHTARRHTEGVLLKLGVHSRAEVAARLLHRVGADAG